MTEVIKMGGVHNTFLHNIPALCLHVGVRYKLQFTSHNYLKQEFMKA